LILPEISEALKETLSQQEHLFEKLKMVAAQYDAIDFDESGLYFEQEAAVKRRWEKLSSKIALALEACEGVEKVALAQTLLPDQRRVGFVITMNEEASAEMMIDYAPDERIEVTFRDLNA